MNYRVVLDQESFEPTSVFAWFMRNTDLRRLSPAEAMAPDQWVVEDEREQIVGMALAATDGHIYRLAIEEPHRGKGLGRKLIDNMLDYYGEVDLECRESLDANDFYSHIGMERTETRWGEPEDLYVWKLSKG